MPKNESLEDFLARMEKLPREPFKPCAFHNTPGNLLEVFWENVDHYAERLNATVTLLKAQDDNRVVGCQVWGLSKIMSDESSER